MTEQVTEKSSVQAPPIKPQREVMVTGQNINKKFYLETETTHVLKDINFTVPKSSFTIIYGPSGSGKSTLLNCLVGLEPPTTGQVIVDGQDLYSLNTDQRANFRARTLGLVYQTNYWVNSLSVIDNVSMPLYLAGYGKRQANLIAEESLERVGMADYKSKKPTVLSGGQQQRVSMARALVANPSWIVADEPTGNLDTKNGDMIMGLLNELKYKMGKTVVLITHNMEYLTLSDHRLHIRDGVLTEEDGDFGLNQAEKSQKLSEFQAALAGQKSANNNTASNTKRPIGGLSLASLAKVDPMSESESKTPPKKIDVKTTTDIEKNIDDKESKS